MDVIEDVLDKDADVDVNDVELGKDVDVDDVGVEQVHVEQIPDGIFLECGGEDVDIHDVDVELVHVEQCRTGSCDRA